MLTITLPLQRHMKSAIRQLCWSISVVKPQPHVFIEAQRISLLHAQTHDWHGLAYGLPHFCPTLSSPPPWFTKSNPSDRQHSAKSCRSLASIKIEEIQRFSIDLDG